MLVFEQGHLLKKNLSRAIFPSVNYLSSALVKENLSYFPFTLPRKICQGKTCQGELASLYSQLVFLGRGTCKGKLYIFGSFILEYLRQKLPLVDSLVLYD